MPMCEYEIEILREVADEKPVSAWGAAVGAALAYLKGSGYIDGSGITDKGRAALTPGDARAADAVGEA